MSRTKKTYIVNDRHNRSHTLRDWCAERGLNYNTILARIWRSEPEIVSGVIYFEEGDPILAAEEQRGVPAHGASAPKRDPARKLKAKKVYNKRTGKVAKANRLK